MIITLVNCMAKLQPQNLSPAGAKVESLGSQLQSTIPLTSWTYSFLSDTLEIETADGTVIPDSLSNYGDVVV